MTIVLGEKWAPAVSLLCLFAVSERKLGWLRAAGRPDRWTRWGVLSAVCQLAALAAGLPFGTIGVATAYTVVVYLMFVPALPYSGRPLGVRTKDVLAATGPQTVAALCAVVTGLTIEHTLLADLTHLARLTVASLICLATYLAVAFGVLRVTGPIQLALSLLRDLFLRQSPKAP